MASISIDLLGPVGSVPRPERSDDSEQQQATIERNIQATLRAVDARAERRAVDLAQGEAHAPIGVSGALVRPADVAASVGNAGAPGVVAGSVGSPAPDL